MTRRGCCKVCGSRLPTAARRAASLHRTVTKVLLLIAEEEEKVKDALTLERLMARSMTLARVTGLVEAAEEVVRNEESGLCWHGHKPTETTATGASS